MQFPEIKSVHSQVLQNVAVRVELAFAAFFRRVKAGDKLGFPRFKEEGHDSFTYPPLAERSYHEQTAVGASRKVKTPM